MLKLTKRKEPLFALSCFGPNFVNLFLGVYLVNTILGTNVNEGGQPTIPVFDYSNPGIVLVNVAVFGILFTIAKVIDALLNIPMAHVSDTTKSRWGRRRPCILIGMFIIFLAYIGLCNPLVLTEHSLVNTLWIFLILIIYFVGYTLCLESFYASFPEITYDVQARIRLTSWKAFYDTMVYSIGYAVLPLILGLIAKAQINMRYVALCLSPLYLTMLIPIFLIKEPGTYFIQHWEGIKRKMSEKNYFKNLWISIKNILQNKKFIAWILIFALFYFGLDLFLQGQIPMAQSSMGLNSWQTTIINTAAFAPIPLMLFINKKVINKFGFKVSFLAAILTFIVAITSFCIAYHAWISNTYVILAIATIGSTIGSYGLTTFFSAPYLIPAQCAKEDNAKNQAMFFGVQGICVALANALNEPVWINVSQIGKIGNSGYATTGEIGPHIMTYIVIGVCSLAFIFAIFMPKAFNNIGKLNITHGKRH